MLSMPWSVPGHFFKGNIHAHSSKSDGTKSPEDVIAFYRQDGYDFLSLTDHFQEVYGYPITDTRAFRTSEFTTILGAELTGPRHTSGAPMDILAVGLPLDFVPPDPNESGSSQASRAADVGAFVGLAHPIASKVSMDDALAVAAAHAVEIFNGVVSRDKESWRLSDALSVHGARMTTFAADDNHFLERKPASPLAWVHVRANALAPDALLSALKNGHFYSSQGPRLLDVEIAGDHLALSCSPIQTATLSGADGLHVERNGQALTTVEFPLDDFLGSFCRITVTDEQGMHAWSNPIWLD